MNLFAYGTLMAAEGLREAFGTRADELTIRPARLPGWPRIWNVSCPEWSGGVLDLGTPSGRYRTVVLERAYRAGWEVCESLCRGTVDAAGNPLTLGQFAVS